MPFKRKHGMITQIKLQITQIAQANTGVMVDDSLERNGVVGGCKIDLKPILQYSSTSNLCNQCRH